MARRRARANDTIQPVDDARAAFKPGDDVTWSPPTSKKLITIHYPAKVLYISQHKIAIRFETPDGRIIDKFVYARSLAKL